MAMAGLLLCSAPLFVQYTGNNVTPAGSSTAVLTSTSGTNVTGNNGHALAHDTNLNQTTDLNSLGATSSLATSTDGVEVAAIPKVRLHITLNVASRREIRLRL